MDRIEVLFESGLQKKPAVSLILLDWSCRESFHMLHYLSKQTIPRDNYEIIWIEYYGRHSEVIKNGLEKCQRAGIAPIIDKWIVMNMPEDVYYHKHLMYNMGIISSKGNIVTICDSDVLVEPTFVESIINSFDRDPNIVLHLDEVRNNDRNYYPFNYPSMDDIMGSGNINWRNGKTLGLIDKYDPLHTLNYGACMCALRSDLISIGGADEHIDYLGHICGPYELTFRLVNAGKKEIWHQKEYLYHTWHPGTDGKGNYLGPHDGRNMSTTALEARRTGRVMSLVENPAVKALRLDENCDRSNLLNNAIPETALTDWSIESLKKEKKSSWALRKFINKPVLRMLLMVTFLKVLAVQLRMKVNKIKNHRYDTMTILRKVLNVFQFIKNINTYFSYLVSRCDKCLTKLSASDVKKVAVYGSGDVAEVLYRLSSDAKVEIDAVYASNGNETFFKHDVMPMEELKNYAGKVVIADLEATKNTINKLKKAGVDESKLVFL